MSGLIHLTTADLNNIADGIYNVDLIRMELERSDSFVVITRYHLLEWVPRNPTSQRRCLFLPDSLKRTVYCGQTHLNMWRDLSLELRQATPATLIQDFFVSEALDRDPRELVIDPELQSERDFLISMGEADFFARNAERSKRVEESSFNPKVLSKYQKLNRSHGSDPEAQWYQARRLSHRLERVAAMLRPVVPDRIVRRVKNWGERTNKQLEQSRPELHALSLGTDAQTDVYRLYWEVRERLRSDPMEPGGLAEKIDLIELLFLPICSVWSADKRIAPKVKNSIRAHEDLPDEWANRVIRCGDEARLLSALQQLPTA